MYISHNNSGENMKRSGDEFRMKSLFEMLSELFFQVSTPSVAFAVEKSKEIKGAVSFPHIHKTK